MRVLVVVAALAAGAGIAVATPAVEVPTGSAALAQGAAPAPPAPAAPAAAPAVAAPAAPATAPATTRASRKVKAVVRMGSYGRLVRDLQRELRRRGQKITVDGAFGPATKRAVKRMQKRYKMRPTGVADARLLKRLGLRTRMAAGAPVASTPARLVAPGASQYLEVFPVQGDNSYSADFGAGRHQGSHQGVDIMADRGTPLVAVTSGVVSRLTRTETGLGGIYVWLKRADGTDYYYAHMHTITAGIAEGTRVGAGQVIGTVGNTGDARYGAPHLHFEIRPAGSSPIDPYSHLVAVDPTARTQARSRR